MMHITNQGEKKKMVNPKIKKLEWNLLFDKLAILTNIRG
jgi:hypothetical protein